MAAGTAGSSKDHGGATFQAALTCARRGEGVSCVGKGQGDHGRRAGGSETEGQRRRAAASAGTAGALSAKFCSDCLCSK
jgi:hypothetical protein